MRAEVMPVWRIVVRGTVQGVGFRPFVKRLADRRQLAGSVYNTGDGVIVELECDEDAASQFSEDLAREKPPLAHITECRLEAGTGSGSSACGIARFTIETSRAIHGAFTLVSPDIAVCADCLREMRDPADRRFGYAFTNCTNCGPRYTIVRATPYDRANTTMAPFAMCADCAAEYGDPADRRFHAEPVACAVCGPRLSAPIADIIGALVREEIVAIKGLGGFQLACDALSDSACSRLRDRKRRSNKPFALMMRDVDTAAKFCMLSGGEPELLHSRAAPIVLLTLREDAGLPDAIAPGLDRVGVMLPNTPMHHQLFVGPIECLVMTSGNISEEPIVIYNEEARSRLAALADRFLTHDREIFMRADDSVTRWFDGAPRLIRRARGYAPEAIDLGFEPGEALGVGAELKNTFCLTKGRYGIVSQHIGDFENLETQKFFEETLRNLKSVYQAAPVVLGHDLHPDYLSTRWALAQPEAKIAVQHHHAHIASCMAENGIRGPVIGIAWDGAGYGTDGQVWGGEFLVCDFAAFRRAAHLRYVPLVGGDRVSREGWRAAAAHLFDAFGDASGGDGYSAAVAPLRDAAGVSWWKIFDHMLPRARIRTSSAGRLFDAVAAITGICIESTFEGEAAMLLETAAWRSGREDHYPFTIDSGASPWTIDTRQIIRNVVAERANGDNSGDIARAFHNTLAHIMKALAARLREETALNAVCLSGGIFQNVLLLSRVLSLLRAEGFEVFQHARIPANDGGISLGQAVIAASALKRT
jgi:hydrogenase maturation protein HypF